MNSGMGAKLTAFDILFAILLIFCLIPGYDIFYVGLIIYIIFESFVPLTYYLEFNDSVVDFLGLVSEEITFLLVRSETILDYDLTYLID
jgi:hypothetical protein